jgi:hypothetical protein
MDEPTTSTAQHQRIREFTLLIAQLAAQYEMSDGELAAAAGGACAVGRLLRRVTAEEDGIAVEEATPEALVMLFDSKVRQTVLVEGDAAANEEPLVLTPPAVAYQ